MERKFQDNLDPAILLRRLTCTRLQPYLHASGGDLQGALGLYERNVLWSARLWIFMHFLEITLRNRVDAALSDQFGGDWLEPDRGLLRPRETEKVMESRETLMRYKGEATRDGIIAELNFGFWAFLFSRKYDDAERAFWRKALHRLFPGRPRRDVHDALQGIRKVRNRLAHHERIHRPEKAREAMVRTLRSLSPEMAQWALMIETRADFIP